MPLASPTRAPTPPPPPRQLPLASPMNPFSSTSPNPSLSPHHSASCPVSQHLPPPHPPFSAHSLPAAPVHPHPPPPPQTPLPDIVDESVDRKPSLPVADPPRQLPKAPFAAEELNLVACYKMPVHLLQLCHSQKVRRDYSLIYFLITRPSI